MLENKISNHKIISRLFYSQSSFRGGYSIEELRGCSLQVTNYNDILRFTKTFDIVLHHTLLRKLENMGIRGIVNKLIQLYSNLTNSTLKVEYVGPHVLAPLLFCVRK